MTTTLTELARQVMLTADPAEKARAAQRAAEAWRADPQMPIGDTLPPDRPARPANPPLRPPREVPRRRINSGPAGRIALLHALAHIELNAIDLAFDILARFNTEDLPRAFYDDWVAVGDDEARHYLILAERLGELDAGYGDMVAHDGLWQAAVETADDLMARIALVPLVLEARGLDVTPATVAKLRSVGDDRSADILQIIHDEEIAHVAAGARWFRHLCEGRGLDPASAYGDLVRARFKGVLKPPFNRASRDAAGFPAEYYEPVAES